MKAHTSIFIICAALIAAFMVSAGCGRVSLSSDGGTDIDAAPADSAVPDVCTGDVAIENAWQCTVSTVCGIIAECFGEPFTVDTCMQLDLQVFDLSARYGDILLLNAVGQGTVDYYPQAMGECLDTLRGLTCADLFSGFDPFDSCAGFVGSMPPDSACVLDAECAAPGSRCERPNCQSDAMCCMGVCSTTVPVGGTCAGGQACEPGAYCVDGLCRAGGIGARCNADYDCDANNWCDGTTCVADFQAGSACLDNDQCLRPTTCVGTNQPQGGTCQRSIETGDICDNSCSSFASHFCDRPDATSLGTCQPRLTDGSTCAVEAMPCRLGSRCETTSLTCMPAGSPGTSCTSGSDCSYFMGVYCSNEIDNAPSGVCQERLSDNSLCNNDSHCDSGYCLQRTCTPVAACY